MIPPEAIKEFKALYLKHFGVQLSDAEASLRATSLINLYKTVLRPRPQDSLKSTDNIT